MLVQNILVALVSFFPVNEDVLAVGAIRSSKKERLALALKSPHWVCKDCKMTNQAISEEWMLDLSDESVVEAELKAASAGPLA